MYVAFETYTYQCDSGFRRKFIFYYISVSKVRLLFMPPCTKWLFSRVEFNNNSESVIIAKKNVKHEFLDEH